MSRFEQELQLKDSMARRTSMSSISDMQSAVKPSECGWDGRVEEFVSMVARRENADILDSSVSTDSMFE